ncbi:DUF3786 domain-containing protein [Desulfoferrobacter suflitae]|uniref:DUF3786 domain-containing protein n=1 Tax=Desulfoferrobacter suflitae TaxID=2865782 RepID=UPI002164A46E|nr:DUF3786 domain-containing protein [Desulfoferrobacter suflitae]MCK8600734.1 DUF3786 domain-containing protein [Desulfoferrobacter suflitae]
MSENYLKIQQDYLQKAWTRPRQVLERSIPAEHRRECLHFQAFGRHCALCRDHIVLGQETATGPEGLLVAMYASCTVDKQVQIHPPISFKELPGSLPYHGAFYANAERILVPHVPAIAHKQKEIVASFAGHVNADAVSGDFSFTLYPLPRIPLYYIFHLPDDEFPASVTCLFAANAIDFMPLDGLADVAEYTARRVRSMTAGSGGQNNRTP